PSSVSDCPHLGEPALEQLSQNASADSSISWRGSRLPSVALDLGYRFGDCVLFHCWRKGPLAPAVVDKHLDAGCADGMPGGDDLVVCYSFAVAQSRVGPRITYYNPERCPTSRRNFDVHSLTASGTTTILVFTTFIAGHLSRQHWKVRCGRRRFRGTITAGNGSPKLWPQNQCQWIRFPLSASSAKTSATAPAVVCTNKDASKSFLVWAM